MTISAKSAEKPKRGRPALNDPRVLSALADLFPERVRGREDKARALRFLAARQQGLQLALAHGLTWIADKAQIDRGGAARMGLCAELGLLLRAGWPEADVVEVARQVCEERPSVTAAVERLRALRRRPARPSGSWVMLARALERTLNGYLARHPDLPWSEAVEALEFVAQECRESATASPSGGPASRAP